MILDNVIKIEALAYGKGYLDGKKAGFEEGKNQTLLSISKLIPEVTPAEFENERFSQ